MKNHHVIPILGRDYEIRYKKLSPDEFGEIRKDEGEIWVRKGLNADQLRETVVHEVLHGVFHESGLCEIFDGINLNLEEAIVRALDHGLNRSGIIRDMVPEEEDDEEE